MEKKQGFVRIIDVPVPALGNNIADVERFKGKPLKKSLKLTEFQYPWGL